MIARPILPVRWYRRAPLHTRFLFPEPDSLPVTPVLIHRGFGDKCDLFSREFYQEFYRAYGERRDDLSFYRPCRDRFRQNGDIHTRYDPRVFHVLQLLGIDRCRSPASAMCGGSLQIVTVPTQCLPHLHIEEHYGDEWVWCNTSGLYKELLLHVEDDPDSAFRNFRNDIATIRRCEAYLTQHGIPFT